MEVERREIRTNDVLRALASPLVERPSDRLEFELPSGRRVRRTVEYRYAPESAGDPGFGMEWCRCCGMPAYPPLRCECCGAPGAGLLRP